VRRALERALLVALGMAGLAQAGRALPGPAAFPFVPVPPSASRIHWTHTAGKSKAKYLPETTGAGAAFFDYDNDGWMDLYLVNSGPSDFYDPPQALRGALYRNDHDGGFTDVTARAGLLPGGYGQGAAAGDYDGDGFADLYVTQYGRSVLYRNNRDGTFSDVTERAGVAAPGWASSALWFDFDNDGRLDLFVGRFADFTKAKHRPCADRREPEYCIPKLYAPMASRLFHNEGDGTFKDVSARAGIAGHAGKAWGAVAADVNNDGWLDLFVSNDTVENFLFLNRGGLFEEAGLQMGVAMSAEGKARSGMGVDAADYDQDGFMDLFVSNIDHEMFSLYRNDRGEGFVDRAGPTGVAAATRLLSGWGLKFLDYDNDGHLDLFLANGHPDDLVDGLRMRVTYRQPLLLFRGSGSGLQDVSATAGPVFTRPHSARGLAAGDFDNDGGLDVLVTVNDGAPLLLRNQAAVGSHWLGLRLVGRRANPDAVGARVSWAAGAGVRSRTRVAGGSFLSTHDPRVVLGLGPATRLEWLEVRWPAPSGLVQRFTGLPVDRYITLVEGGAGWE